MFPACNLHLASDFIFSFCLALHLLLSIEHPSWLNLSCSKLLCIFIRFNLQLLFKLSMIYIAVLFLAPYGLGQSLFYWFHARVMLNLVLN